MPLYMDVHEKVEGLMAEAVAEAHKKDLETQRPGGELGTSPVNA